MVEGDVADDSESPVGIKRAPSRSSSSSTSMSVVETVLVAGGVSSDGAAPACPYRPRERMASYVIFFIDKCLPMLTVVVANL